MHVSTHALLSLGMWLCSEPTSYIQTPVKVKVIEQTPNFLVTSNWGKKVMSRKEFTKQVRDQTVEKCQEGVANKKIQGYGWLYHSKVELK